MAAKETPVTRFYEYIGLYGVEVVNKIIERHHLANEKRALFSIRFAETDTDKEKEITENMEKIDELIYKIDRELMDCYDIDSRLRTQIIRDVKKARPDDWFGGFSV